MDKDLVSVVYAHFKRVRSLMEQSLPAVKNEVNYIIREQERESKKIERVLDILLDYASMGFGEAEFKMLNRYYATFNPRNAKFYSEFFRDITR